MKTNSIFFLSALFACTTLHAQTAIIGNNSSNSADYLGWDASVIIPLEIKHENNRNIRFSTDGILSWGIRNDGKVLGGTTNPANGRLRVLLENQPTINYAVYGRGSGNDGGLFVAKGSPTNVGFAGAAVSDPGSSVFHAGVYGIIPCPDPTIPEFGAGIYGAVNQCPPSGNNWGGYFNGDVFCSTGNYVHSSDANLKTNINTLSGASSIIASLEPRQYEFLPQPEDGLILPEGLQYGLMAQDLEAVIPAAVRDVVYSGGIDPGIYESEPLEFKAVNYELIIPVLIAAFQERQSSLEEATATLTALETEVHRLENRAAIAQYERLHSE